MGVCAICHRTDVRYSVEHVIPEALGGCYVRKQMVCVDCNSKLGARVDAALVNHDLSKMFRLVHGLGGKAKKPPNPFAGEYRLRSDPDRKMRIRIGPGGRLTPYFLTETGQKNLPDGRVGVTISVDRADEHKVEPIVRTIAKRLGGSAEEALGTMQKTVTSSEGGLTGELTLDLRNFKIGLLKIAYEFAVDRIPDYVESGDAKQIATILREARFDEVERYVIGNGFDRGVMAPLSNFLGYEGVKHYLVLSSGGEGVRCFVHLDGLFSIGATLSTRVFGSLFEIGVNDVESRRFKVWGIEDMPVSTSYRPLLSFETEREAKAFREAERAKDFAYDSGGGGWKLFARDGRYIGMDIEDVVKTLAPIRSEIASGGMREEFCLGEGIYLRVSGSGEIVRVLAVRAEHVWKKL